MPAGYMQVGVDNGVGLWWGIVERRRSRWLLVLVLIMIGLGLRSINLAGFTPIQQYEASWVVMGEELAEEGLVEVWQKRKEGWQSGQQTIEKIIIPYVEFPPVFSLMVSDWLVKINVGGVEAIDWLVVRIPMMVVAAWSMMLVYWLASLFFGRTMGLFSLVAYVFFPTSVVTARFLAVEHLVAAMLMMAIYCYAIWDRSNDMAERRLAKTGMLILSFLSIWVKLSAIVIPTALLCLAIYHKRMRLVLALLMTMLVSGWLFYGYAFFWDSDLWLRTWSWYEAQDMTFTDTWMFIVFLDIGNWRFYDPSVIVGAVGFFILIANNQGRRAAQYFLLVLLAIVGIFLFRSPQAHFAWQRYVLHPFFAIGLGYVFYKLAKGEKAWLVLFLPLLSVIWQQSGVVSDQLGRKQLVLAIYAITLFPLLLGRKRLPSLAVYVLMLITLFLLESWWVLKVLSV